MSRAAQEAAERAIRVAISRGDMPPGYRLVEAELVALTGASRSAVRLAIDALAAEGLVERIQNKGARVRVVSLEEAIAITECRMPLEGLLARKAAERITDRRGRSAAGSPRPGCRRGRRRRRAEVLRSHPAAARHGPRGRTSSGGGRAGRPSAGAAGAAPVPVSLRPGRPRVSLAGLAAVVDAVVRRDADRAEALPWRTSAASSRSSRSARQDAGEQVMTTVGDECGDGVVSAGRDPLL